MPKLCRIALAASRRADVEVEGVSKLEAEIREGLTRVQPLGGGVPGGSR